MLAGQIEERWQQRPLGDLARADELRDLKCLLAEMPDAWLVLQVDVRKRAVGRAKVDADEVTHALLESVLRAGGCKGL